jgi:recombinational DNA repair protein RecR
MKDKHYGLTDPPNKGKTDNAPEWMDNLFTKKEEKPKEDLSKLFEKPKSTVKKCSCCGKILKENEVGYCSDCI